MTQALYAHMNHKTIKKKKNQEKKNQTNPGNKKSL
jgi:hypothetical protein